MGHNDNDIENKRARNDERLMQMLEDAYEIGVNAMAKARELSGGKTAKGIAGWMHVAEKAIGEIVRLDSMTKNVAENRKPTVVVDFLTPPKETVNA